MGVRSKTFITVLLVGAVAAVVTLQVQNKELFKGQIFEGGEQEETTQEASPNTLQAKPDLTGSLEIIAPESEQDDISVNVTILNEGPGAIEGGETFEYKISINGEEVLTNSDSFSALEAADSFSFTYPIPRTIYQYSNSGNIEFEVDTNDSIDENDETNNLMSQDFNF